MEKNSTMEVNHYDRYYQALENGWEPDTFAICERFNRPPAYCGIPITAHNFELQALGVLKDFL